MKSKLSAALAAAGRALNPKGACLLALVPALILPMSASYAGTFTFTESNSTIIASGQLAGPFQLGQAPVTSVSGTFDGFAITGLLAPHPLIFIFQPDNILFDRPPFVDIFVILFSTVNQWRTFSTTEQMRSPVVPFADLTVDTGTGPGVTSVPGPVVGADLATLILACGGLLTLARWRQKIP